MYGAITGVWDKADEGRQALDCMYNAVPKACRQKHNPSGSKGAGAKADVIAACAGSMNMSAMVSCLVFNHVSDKIIGRAHGLPRKGQRKAIQSGYAHGGRPGWGAGIGL